MARKDRAPARSTAKEDPDELVQIAFRVPRALRQRLSAILEESGVTLQDFGQRAFQSELELREILLDEQRAMLDALVKREAELRGVSQRTAARQRKSRPAHQQRRS